MECEFYKGVIFGGCLITSIEINRYEPESVSTDKGLEYLYQISLLHLFF